MAAQPSSGVVHMAKSARPHRHLLVRVKPDAEYHNLRVAGFTFSAYSTTIIREEDVDPQAFREILESPSLDCQEETP